MRPPILDPRDLSRGQAWGGGALHIRRFLPGKTASHVDHVLRYVVWSASAHIPAYRELLERSGVSASCFRSAADLPLLPIVEKQSLFHDSPLQQQMHDRAKASRCVQTSTSGSTGIPVSIYMSRAEALFRRAQVLSAWRSIVRLPFPLRVADLSSWITNESGFVLVRRCSFSILRVSSALPVDLRIRLLARYDPHVISSCPTTLEPVAQRLAESPVPFPSIRLVALQGEVLYETVRAGIERAFGCRVAEFYNCEEIGNVASECPEDPSVLHINTDACVVEIIDEGGRALLPGQEGRILLTNLYNCTMPFIRYRIADRGVLLPLTARGKCACGSQRPRMGLLGGREDDYVSLPNGQRASPRLVCTIVERAAMDPLPRGSTSWRFRRFQVVQDEPDHITVRIIPERDRLTDLKEVIARGLRKLDPALRCSVAIVDDLPLEPSGKFKRVIHSNGLRDDW